MDEVYDVIVLGTGLKVKGYLGLPHNRVVISMM